MKNELVPVIIYTVTMINNPCLSRFYFIYLSLSRSVSLKVNKAKKMQLVIKQRNQPTNQKKKSKVPYPGNVPVLENYCLVAFTVIWTVTKH